MTQFIVQDVFSSGVHGPSYRIFDSLAEAQADTGEHPESRSEPFPLAECQCCGSALGLDRQPLDGGCSECR